MPNYNPTETNSLMALLTGLRGGMDPSMAYGMYGDVLNQAMARTQERKNRLNTLTDLLVNNAQAGATYGGVQSIADAYTHGRGGELPPRIEDTVQGLFPATGPAAYTPPPGADSELRYAGQGGVGLPTPTSLSPAMIPPDAAQEQQLALGQQQLDQGKATSAQAAAITSMAPVIAQAFATQAATNLQTPDATTGIVPTADSVMAKMVVSDEFLALDPVTQAKVVEAVKAALMPGGAGGATPAPTQQAGPPVAPGMGSSLSLVGGLNSENTRWQDVFGMFPGLFG